MEPLISVVVPVYKVEKYLMQCVDSILNQSFTDFELILVDDGSPDSCPIICDEYAKQDKRIKVIHKQNGGLSSARNAGIDGAIGRYVIFIDSDDYYSDNDFFNSVAKKIRKADVDIIFFRYKKVFEDGNEKIVLPYDKTAIADLENDVLINYLSLNDQLDSSACSKIFNRSFLMKNDLYFKVGMYSEDIEWMIRCLMCLHTASFLYNIPYCYRIRAGSISHSIKMKNIEDVFYSIETYAPIMKTMFGEFPNSEACLNYIAYQYFIVIGLTGRYLHNEEKRKFLKKLRCYKWLCNFAKSPKNKKAMFVVKFLGVRLSGLILGEYIRKK